MEGLNFIRQLFDYDYWANLEALTSLSTVGCDAEKARKFFTHVLGAQRIWLGRFASPEPPTAEPWPVLGGEECRAAIEDVHRRCMALLDGLTPEKLDGNLA